MMFPAQPDHLTNTDLQFVVARTPKDVREAMKILPLFLGGGFIRETIGGGEVKDIDMFGTSKEALNVIAATISEKREGYSFATDNAITLLSPPRLPLQFITRWCYDDPVKVAESFDFTVCQAVIWYDQRKVRWQSAISEHFYADLAARRLVYTYPVREEEAGGSLMRVIKFARRGYNIQAPSIAGVVTRLIGAVDFTKATTEFKIAEVLTGLLREVDPMVAIDGIDLVDEHEVIP